VRLADLETLYVECDIFEGELRRLSPGMKATISSSSLPMDLEGVVEEIGGIVNRRSQMGQVMVRLLDSASAAGMLDMQVDVAIHLTP